MGIQTTDDRRLLDKLLKAIPELDRAFVTVGVNQKEGIVVHPGNPSRSGSESGATVAEIAFFNEFGTKRIRERSFIRSAIDEKKPKLEGFLCRQLDKIAAGKISVKTGISALGFKMQTAIRNKIITFRSPGNADATIANKGFDNPLIDSELLLNSITFEVNGK